MYDVLDLRIVKAIRNGYSPLYERHVTTEARRIAEATGRETFRVIDGRVTALKKAGKIRYFKQKDKAGVIGWVVMEDWK